MAIRFILNAALFDIRRWRVCGYESWMKLVGHQWILGGPILCQIAAILNLDLKSLAYSSAPASTRRPRG